MPQKKYHGVLHYHRRIRHKTIRTIRVKFGEYSRGHKARTKKALSIICRHSIDASRRTCGKLDDVNRQALLSSITDKKTRSSVTISATIYYTLSAHLTHNVYLLLMNSWNKLFFFPYRLGALISLQPERQEVQYYTSPRRTLREGIPLETDERNV